MLYFLSCIFLSVWFYFFNISLYGLSKDLLLAEKKPNSVGFFHSILLMAFLLHLKSCSTALSSSC